MARIFVTGSSTGLGLRAGQALTRRGHAVVLHARDGARASDAMVALPEAEHVVVGDLETVRGAIKVADAVNVHGRFDAVIHNAGMGDAGGQRSTRDGNPAIFAVNVLAPYVLICLVTRPKRFVYLSSSMHRVQPELDDVLWRTRRWNGTQAYSESKLYVTALCMAVARLWPDVAANAVDPGWVPTRMGGAGAPDDIEMGCATQVELALDEAPQLAGLTGQYLHHMAMRKPAGAASDVELQN